MVQLDRGKNLYRLATYFIGQDEPKNLCDLVKRLTWNIFILSTICIISGALLGDLLASLVVLVVHQHFQLSLGFIVIGGIISIVLAGIIAGSLIVGLKHLILKDTNCESVELAKEWVSAKKSKICPMIRYK